MTPPEHAGPPEQARNGQLRSNLRWISLDGASHAAMLGVGEAYVPALALAAGYGDLVAGLSASLPMLAGGLLQLASPYAVARLGSYRRWVVACAASQALAFLPLAAACFTGRVPLALTAVVVTIYWAAGMGTGPAWNAWIELLVPRAVRPTFLARRNRLAQTALLGGLLAGGGLLQLGRDAGLELTAFGAIFLLAAGARSLSATCLHQQSEPPGSAGGLRRVGPAELVRRTVRGADGRLLVYLIATQTGVHVSAPFFTPFMLGPLDLDYGRYTLLIAISFLAKVVALPALGGLARRNGAGRLLWLGGIGVVPLPALWLLWDNFTYLCALQVLSGVAWAAHELATLLLFFDTIPRHERTSVLTLFNLANALAIAAGAALGGSVFLYFGTTLDAYIAIFVLSSGLRTLTLVPLFTLPALVRPSLAVPELRPLAARPGSGSIDRPILASIDLEEGRPGYAVAAEAQLDDQ